jgi:ABC-type uncharacterized transport system permease subunit
MFRQVGYKLTNLIKNIMAFKNIFKKTNDYNEKTVVGFLSFTVMVLVMITDLVTGYMGQDLKLNEYVFNAFMYITLGSFGIAGLEKFAGSKGNSESE